MAEPAMEQEASVEEGESNVSPEEQEQYNLFMAKVADILYGPGGGTAKVMPEILESLSAAKGSGGEATVEGVAPGEELEGEKGNPAVLALANTAVQVVQKVDTAGFEAGSPVSDEVLYHAAVETIELLAEVAETAGIHEYSEEELNGALYQAVDLYRPIAEELGRTDQETLKGQFAEVNQADQEGRLGELLPGIEGATMGEPPVQAEQ